MKRIAAALVLAGCAHTHPEATQAPPEPALPSTQPQPLAPVEVPKPQVEEGLVIDYRAQAEGHTLIEVARPRDAQVEIYGAGQRLIGKDSAPMATRVDSDEYYRVHVRLPSGEVRLVALECMATVGQVSNLEHSSLTLGQAGRKRWLGIRPTVRGSAMDPASHPHGGGEGRSPIGMPGPVTPWGKPTLGYKTRKPKTSDKFIVKRRN